MTVEAIVVTHNSRTHVAHCLEPLIEAGVATWVVDNASSDDTVRVVAERFPEVHLLANHDNRGFAQGVNQALEQTSADVVLLVNPDCAVSPEAVAGLAAHLAENPEVGVVAPRLRDSAGRIAVSTHPFENLASIVGSRFGAAVIPPALRGFVVRGCRRSSYEACRSGDRPVPVDWVSGACLAVRGSLLRRLGGLDTAYFMYYEDEELCLQVWRSGATVVYLPTVEAVHSGGASTRDPAQAWPHLYRGLLRFQARHRPRTYPLVRAAIVVRAVLGVAWGAARDSVALVQRKPARRTRAWARIFRVALLESKAISAEGRS